MWPNSKKTGDLVTFTEEIMESFIFCAVVLVQIKMEEELVFRELPRAKNQQWIVELTNQIREHSWPLPHSSVIKQKCNYVTASFYPADIYLLKVYNKRH